MSYLAMGSAHGFVVGGGVACMPRTDVEAILFLMTFSFGNVSRGHVPIMLLSKGLPWPIGFAGVQWPHLADSVVGVELALHSSSLHMVSTQALHARMISHELAMRSARAPV